MAQISLRIEDESVDPFYSQENMTRLRDSVAQMEATGGTVHEVDFDKQDHLEDASD